MWRHCVKKYPVKRKSGFLDVSEKNKILKIFFWSLFIFCVFLGFTTMGGPGKAKKQRIEALKKANEALERSRQVSAPENEENDVFEVVDCFFKHDFGTVETQRY
jgi:hypothetical protein